MEENRAVGPLEKSQTTHTADQAVPISDVTKNVSADARYKWAVCTDEMSTAE